MKKQKADMVSIQFWCHEWLKAKLERYCEEKGLTMAEAMRCYILNLPEPDEEGKKKDGV
jgi:hypothetical protein